jgi:hypothetical protein
MQKSLFENRTTQYQSLLKEVAENHDVEPDLLHDLISYEQGRVHLKKRRGAKTDIKQKIQERLDQ